MLAIQIKELDNRCYRVDILEDRNELYKDLELLDDPFDYTVTGITSDRNWAKFDAYTNVDDVIQVYERLKQLPKEKYEQFIEHAHLGIQDPYSILDEL